MSVLESLPVALFVFAMVFALLAVLYILIVLFSVGIRAIEKRHRAAAANLMVIESEVTAVPAEPEEIFSSGHLKLQNVDERTAAMIMAIVSDESGIPLSELCFKSIKGKV